MSTENDSRSLSTTVSATRETTSHHATDSDSRTIVVEETPAAFVERVYLGPLRAMPDDGNHTFIVLLLTLALYEKHARCLLGFTGGSFGDGHPIFDCLATDLGISTATDAAEFWRQFRNGVFHRAFPKSATGYRLQTTSAVPVELTSGGFVVNPFAVRDRLLPTIAAGIPNWADDPESTLPKTLER